MTPLAVVIADTHIPRRAKELPEALLPHLKRADLILHAGDLMDPVETPRRGVSTPGVSTDAVGQPADDLERYAPTRAVRGNLDPPDLDLPETLEFEFGGLSVAMVHDSGPKRGRRPRMRRRFPDARVVVFGHSHIPWLDDEDGLMLLNPGSPTDKRRQSRHTFALLWAGNGEVRVEIVAL